MGKLYSDLKLAHVSGRGHGKTAKAQAWLQSQSGEMVPVGIVDTGVSIGPVDVATGEVHKVQNFTADMTFETEYVITQEQMRKMYERGRKPNDKWADWINEEWARITDSRFQTNVLGHWPYTPADELRDRLNDWLQGKEPLEAINTRYWRDWK